MTDTATHQATPEQWERLRLYCAEFPGSANYAGSCLLEVLARLERLEALLRAPGQPEPEGLLDTVANAIEQSAEESTCECWHPEALVAIEAVAEWLEHEGHDWAAENLRAEVAHG